MFKFIYPYKITVTKDLTNQLVRKKVITGIGHIARQVGTKLMTLCGKDKSEFQGGGCSHDGPT